MQAVSSLLPRAGAKALLLRRLVPSAAATLVVALSANVLGDALVERLAARRAAP
jgi:hypothetical protein